MDRFTHTSISSFSSTPILIGPPHIANLVLSALFGITSVQTFFYFTRRKEGRSATERLLIFVLWILDAAHFFLVCFTHYHYVIDNFDNPSILLHINKTANIVVFATTASDAIIRGIFAWRLWRFSKRNVPLLCVISLGSFVNFSASIGFASNTFRLALFHEYERYSWLIYTALISAAATDLIIALSQCVLLRRSCREVLQFCPEVKQSSSVVRVLMFYSINTGMVTSICSVACLLSYAFLPSTFIYDAFYWVLPTLYLNALLASLNARNKLRETLKGDVVNLPDIPILPITNAPRTSRASISFHIPPRRRQTSPLPGRPYSIQTMQLVDVSDPTVLLEAGKASPSIIPAQLNLSVTPPRLSFSIAHDYQAEDITFRQTDSLSSVYLTDIPPAQ